MKPKTRKAIFSRFKITKSGKFLHLPQGQDHFRAKKSGKKKRKLRKLVRLDPKIAKKLKKFLYFTSRKKK